MGSMFGSGITMGVWDDGSQAGDDEITGEGRGVLLLAICEYGFLS